MTDTENRYHLIFLSGVPATGKSSYGQWLEEKRGFIHLDVEENQTAPLKIELKSRVWTDAKLVAYLRSLRSNVIVNQGFTPNGDSLAYLAALKNEGMKLWWFHSERETARRAFEIRNGLAEEDEISLESFETQMDRIENHWDSLLALFEPNIIQTLHSDMSGMAPKDIYAVMFDNSQN